MNKKYVVIIAVVLLLIAGGFMFFKGRKTTVPGGEKMEQKSQDIMKKVEEANKKVETKKIPDDLKQCTAEILKNAGNCTTLPKADVCGYDHTVYGDGKIQDHALTYKGSCYYCQLFGDDNLMEIVDTKVNALGYKEGACQ